MAIINHKYPEQKLRKLTRNEDADCASCAFSEKTRTVDGVDEYLCKAALYDIKTLACYVAKMDGGADNGWIESLSVLQGRS